MKVIKESDLRKAIRKELTLALKKAERLNESLPVGDEVSNAELAKGLKSGAADMAANIPAKLNDEFASMIRSLTAMAQHDKSKFMKIKDLIGKFDDASMEKLKK